MIPVQSNAAGVGREAPVDPWPEALLSTLLERWRTSSVTANGIYYVCLDRQWRRRPCPAATLVSQCRLIYNFSRGFELTGDGLYSEAAHHGLRALDRFFSGCDGGFCWSVGLDGAQIDDRRDSYGHAFAVLALATAARVFEDSSLTEQAAAVLHFLKATCFDSRGGVLLEAGRAGGRRSQNPMMHLFEALMALGAVDETGEALDTARQILAFLQALPRFTDGRLIELYTSGWDPLPADEGGNINIGHQFEWAYLLSDWHVLTGDGAALETGRKFLATGIGWGLDPSGGAAHAADPDGRVICAAHGLWQQAEAVRALQRYTRNHADPAAAGALPPAAAFYRRCFIDEEHGGVFADPACGDGPHSTAKGDCWKLDYHSLNMCRELLPALHAQEPIGKS